jgi:hypothetical protein
MDPPPAVGADEAQANLTIWFVDDSRAAARWAETGRSSHERLLQSLRAAGLSPRLEHMGEHDFPGRWKEAEQQGRLPQLVAATRWRGEVRSLEQSGAFRSVASQRLAHDESVCPDFAHRFLLMPRASAHAAETPEALRGQLKPPALSRLPGPSITVRTSRLEAEHVARRAVAAYLSGDIDRLKAVASARSSQFAECTVPGRWNAGMTVQTGEVDLRGRGDLAAAVVESFFEGKDVLGADPIAVVLVREQERWRALAVCRDFVTVREAVPRLCDALGRVRPRDGRPVSPALIEPLEGQDLGAARPFLVWSVPDGGEPLLAQVFEQHFGDLADKDAHWPEARLEVFPPEPRGGKVNPFAGVVGSRMSWTVWTIGESGRITVAAARRFGIGR